MIGMDGGREKVDPPLASVTFSMVTFGSLRISLIMPAPPAEMEKAGPRP